MPVAKIQAIEVSLLGMMVFLFFFRRRRLSAYGGDQPMAEKKLIFIDTNEGR
jgi:hypothetical protein